MAEKAPSPGVTLGVADQETRDKVEKRVETNLSSPQIPKTAVQKHTALSKDSRQFATGKGSKISEDVQLATAQPSKLTLSQNQARTTGRWMSGDVAAGRVFAHGTIKDAAEGSVSQLFDPATGELTAEAIAAQGKVDPQSLVQAAVGVQGDAAKAAQATFDPSAQAATTKYDESGRAVAATADLPEQAKMTTQLDGLLKDLEGGNVPMWAKPAVEQVEAALARRGMSRSSIGRDALFNAIIQSALPLAQENARAEQQRAAQNLSNLQQAGMFDAQTRVGIQMANLSNEQQAAMFNAQERAGIRTANLNNQQQAALFNAQAKVNMNMANLSNEQQAQVMNSQTLQTMSLSNLNNQQQAVMQNAVANAAMDQSNLNAQQQARSQNAQAFLQMDMANLSNEQQTALFNAQTRTQALLSDQAARNAARQFNAANQQQADQFNAQLGQQNNQFNAAQLAAFRESWANRENAKRQFVAQNELAREQFNASMSSQIEQSNVQWRRQMNQIDTAGKNAVNQANAINAFNLSNQSLTFMWQDLRDSAQWSFQAGQNKAERDTRVAIAALSNEQKEKDRNAEIWQSAGSFVSSLLK